MVQKALPLIRTIRTIRTLVPRYERYEVRMHPILNVSQRLVSTVHFILRDSYFEGPTL